MTSKDQGLAGDLAAIRDALLYAQSWICSAPHGDNCYVSSHYEGDPGNQCNCGKEGVEQAVESALATPVATPEPDLPSWLMKEWDGGDEEEYWRISAELERNRLATTATGEPTPIDMVLHCPKCGLQHVDAPEGPHQEYLGPIAGITTVAWDWENPPHKSHLCHGCAHIWRPADVATNGVAAVTTKGKSDSPVATGEPTDATENAKLREALRDLLNDTQHKEHIDCEDGPCPVREARELLAASKEQQ